MSVSVFSGFISPHYLKRHEFSTKRQETKKNKLPQKRPVCFSEICWSFKQHKRVLDTNTAVCQPTQMAHPRMITLPRTRGMCTLTFPLLVKVVFIYPNPVYFCQIHQMSPYTSLAVCVCTENNSMLVHSPDSGNGETKKVAWAESHSTLPANQ